MMAVMMMWGVMIGSSTSLVKQEESAANGPSEEMLIVRSRRQSTPTSLSLGQARCPRTDSATTPCLCLCVSVCAVVASLEDGPDDALEELGGMGREVGAKVLGGHTEKPGGWKQNAGSGLKEAAGRENGVRGSGPERWDG